MLRAARSRFGSLLDGVFNGVIMLDPGAETIAVANAAAGEALGYGCEEIRGMSLWELVPEEHVDEAKGILQRIFKDGSLKADGLALKRKDGQLLHCKCNVSLLGEPPQRLIQVVFENVGEKKQLIRQLAELGKALSLSEFISGIVHEINNPLAAILGYAQLSLTTTSRKKLDEYLQTINRQAGRCQAIAQKLLSFSRRQEPERKVTDLNRVIQEVVSLFSYELRTSNIKVSLSLWPSPLPVHVDPGQIQQVFVNLINNAREAIARVSEGRLRIESERSGGRAVALISDNGPGIADHLRRRIFEPFFSTKPQGTGLGLSISKSIVRANEGDVELVSKEGEGATFSLSFPLVRDTLPKEPPADQEPDQDFPSGKTILVIDDEKPIADLVRQILSRAGEKVDVALTPAQAYRRINGKDYDMIVIDIKLPGGDGKEIFRRLKESRPELAEKVVFCTGDILDEETKRFLSGLDNCLVEKPFNVSRIYAVAKRVLQSSS